MQTRKLFEGERALVVAGLVGLIESAVVAAVVLVRGSLVAPEGNLIRAAEAYAALGIFTLTSAALLPLTALGPRVRSVWRWSLMACVFYSYVFEVTQHARGLDPRLSQFWTPLDAVLSQIYFLTSQGYVALYAVLIFQFFRKPRDWQRPLVFLAVRYGIVSTFLGFGAGYWMLAHWQGRLVGQAGNIIAVHAFGFHGIQALPLSGWLLEGSDPRKARARLHAGGLLWLGAGACITIQTALGRSMFEIAPFSVAAAVALAGWAALVLLELGRDRGRDPLVARCRGSHHEGRGAGADLGRRVSDGLRAG
jgi:hypothetical protein